MWNQWPYKPALVRTGIITDFIHIRLQFYTHLHILWLLNPFILSPARFSSSVHIHNFFSLVFSAHREHMYEQIPLESTVLLDVRSYEILSMVFDL